METKSVVLKGLCMALTIFSVGVLCDSWYWPSETTTMKLKTTTTTSRPSPIVDSWYWPSETTTMKLKTTTTTSRPSPIVDSWKWPSETTTMKLKTTTTTSRLSPIVSQDGVVETDPCSPIKANTPNFTAPGRRISEVKHYNRIVTSTTWVTADLQNYNECLDYMWRIKYQQNMKQRLAQCQQTHKNKPVPVDINRLKNDFGIVGGHITADGEFAHMVAIGWERVRKEKSKWNFKCGGSLISPKYVLTAGHCASASKDTTIIDKEPKIVRLGSKNIEDSVGENRKYIDIRIANIKKHPDYKMNINDIALVKLEEKVMFDETIRPVCLGLDFSNMTKGWITGWGKTEQGGKLSKVLLAAEISLLDPSACDVLPKNRNWNGINKQICAGNLSGKVDTCQGDSGGPLQIKVPFINLTSGYMYRVIGITSFGFGCAVPNSPGVYTRVSDYIDWIENIVWN